MISIIFASGSDDSIGYQNKLLWKLKDDLIHFKNTTINSTVVMGYNTFSSLPQGLKNRKYIVLTRKNISNNEIKFTDDYINIINKYKYSKEEVFVIGGSQIYSLFLEHAAKIYHTRVNAKFDYADTFFHFDESLYTKDKEFKFTKDENNEYDFEIIIYLKKDIISEVNTL